MKKVTFFIFWACCALTTSAQQFTVNDIAHATYRAKGIRGVKPCSDGESYTQMSDDSKRIVKYSFRTGKELETVFDVGTARECRFDRFDDYIVSPDDRLILIQTETKYMYRRSFTAVYYLFNVKNNKLEPLSEGGPQQVPLFSPDGTQIAFVRDNNLWLVKLLFGNAESQITRDGKQHEIINGIPDWVYEEEFEFNRAFDFSADSKMIAYIRFDESQVPMYRIPYYKGLAPEIEKYRTYPGFYSYKYPLAGVNNSKVTVHTFDIKSKVDRTLELPSDSDGYIPRIKFTDDPEKLAVMTLNRQQNRFDLYFANPRSTLCKLMVREEDAHYVKEAPYAAIRFYPAHFVMMSERDGYNHLYLYTIGGNLVKQLTKGAWEVIEYIGWDQSRNEFYYISNEGSPLRTALWKIDSKGKRTKLSADEGTNSAIFSKNLKYYINTFSNMTTPPVITLNDHTGKTINTLIDNQELKDKLSRMPMPKKEFFRFTTARGTELNGWMMKPADFDPARKYPVVMYQYSGPGSQQVIDRWSAGSMGNGGIFEAYMAQKGFISVCVDGRGTGGRGADFEKCTYMAIGVKEAEDQVETAKYLQSLPYVDGNNIGIWGWSYGGYETLMAMSEGTPIFKAGVAIAAPTDWHFYDSVYTERFMRTPQENIGGYEAASAIARVDKLHGKLLLIQGSADDNVHYRNNAEYAEALVQADKQFDMQIYTNRDHGIYGGNTRKHLMTRVTEFFIDNLK